MKNTHISLLDTLLDAQEGYEKAHPHKQMRVELHDSNLFEIVIVDRNTGELSSHWRRDIHDVLNKIEELTVGEENCIRLQAEKIQTIISLLNDYQTAFGDTTSVRFDLFPDLSGEFCLVNRRTDAQEFIGFDSLDDAIEQLKSCFSM